MAEAGAAQPVEPVVEPAEAVEPLVEPVVEQAVEPVEPVVEAAEPVMEPVVPVEPEEPGFEEVEMERFDPLITLRVEDRKEFSREVEQFEKALHQRKVIKAMMICDNLLEKQQTFNREEPFASMSRKLYEYLRAAPKYENLLFQQFAALHLSDTLLFYLQDYFRRVQSDINFALGKTFMSEARRRHLALTMNAEARVLVFGANIQHCLGVEDPIGDMYHPSAVDLVMPPTFHCQTSGRHTIWWGHNRLFFGCGIGHNLLEGRTAMENLTKPYRLSIQFRMDEMIVGYYCMPYGTLYQTTHRYYFIGDYRAAVRELVQIVGHEFYNETANQPTSNLWTCDVEPTGNVMRYQASDESKNVIAVNLRGIPRMVRIMPTFWTECDPIIGTERRPIIYLLDGVELTDFYIKDIQSGTIWIVYKNLLYEGFVQFMLKRDNNGDEENLDNYYLLVDLVERRTPTPFLVDHVSSFDESVVMRLGKFPCYIFDHLELRENYYRGRHVHNYMFECVENYMQVHPIREGDNELALDPDVQEQVLDEPNEEHEVEDEEDRGPGTVPCMEYDVTQPTSSGIQNDENAEEEVENAQEEEENAQEEEENAQDDTEELEQEVPEAPEIVVQKAEDVDFPKTPEPAEDVELAKTPETPASAELPKSPEDVLSPVPGPSKSPSSPESVSQAVSTPKLERRRPADPFLDPMYYDPITGELIEVPEQYDPSEPLLNEPTSAETSAETSPDRPKRDYDKRDMRKRMNIIVDTVICEARRLAASELLTDFPLESDGFGRLHPNSRYANYFSFLAYIAMPRLPSRPMKFMDTDMDRLIVTNTAKTLARFRMKTLFQEFERVNYPGCDVWKPVQFLRTRPAPEVDRMDENNYRTLAMRWALDHFVVRLRHARKIHVYEWNTPLHLELFSVILATLRYAHTLIQLRHDPGVYHKIAHVKQTSVFLAELENRIPDNELLFQTMNPGAILQSRIEEGHLVPGDVDLNFNIRVRFRLKHQDPSVEDSLFETTTCREFLNTQNPTLLSFVDEDGVLDLNEVYPSNGHSDRLIALTHFIGDGATDMEQSRRYNERAFFGVGWKFKYVVQHIDRGKTHLLGYLTGRHPGASLVDFNPKEHPEIAEPLYAKDGPPVYCHRDLTRIFSMSTDELPSFLTRRLLVKAMEGLYDKRELAESNIEERVKILDWYFSASMPEAFNDLLKLVIINAKACESRFIRYVLDCYPARARRVIAQYRPGILMWGKVPVPPDCRIRHIKIITEMWPKNEWNRPTRVPPKVLKNRDGSTELGKFRKIAQPDLEEWFLDGAEGILSHYVEQFQQDFPIANPESLETPLSEDDEKTLIEFANDQNEGVNDESEDVEAPRHELNGEIVPVPFMMIENDGEQLEHWTGELNRQADELLDRFNQQ